MKYFKKSNCRIIYNFKVLRGQWQALLNFYNFQTKETENCINTNKLGVDQVITECSSLPAEGKDESYNIKTSTDGEIPTQDGQYEGRV